MIAFEEALRALADRFGVEPPAPGDDGARAFDLDDGLRLEVRPTPDGAAFLAAATLAEPVRDGAEDEKKAAGLLRLRLARMRVDAETVAARDPSGAFVAYRLARPERADEWIEGVGRLLNEAEALRRLLTTTTAPPGGPMPLFAGAWFLRP